MVSDGGVCAIWQCFAEVYVGTETKFGEKWTENGAVDGDVAARGLMSGRDGRMSGVPDVRAVGASFCAPWTPVPDVRDLGRISGGGRMSRLDARCPVAVVSSADGWPCRSPGAGCPGSWPDVRCLEVVLAVFHWFSSSMDLGS